MRGDRFPIRFFSVFEFPIRFTDVKTINGIVTTHNRLIIAVREIERATSPLAKEVSILEVTPPGAAAIIITPKSGGGIHPLLKPTTPTFNVVAKTNQAVWKPNGA